MFDPSSEYQLFSGFFSVELKDQNVENTYVVIKIHSSLCINFRSIIFIIVIILWKWRIMMKEKFLPSSGNSLYYYEWLLVKYHQNIYICAEELNTLLL
jgi:hypothetical protein